MPDVSSLRRQLLKLHQTLVDAERIEYERSHGRASGNALLDALISDPAFAWLKQLTTLIVQLDELEDDAREPGRDAQLFGHMRELLRPDAAGNAFQQRYATLLQQNPDVIVAHAAVTQALR